MIESPAASAQEQAEQDVEPTAQQASDALIDPQTTPHDHSLIELKFKFNLKQKYQNQKLITNHKLEKEEGGIFSRSCGIHDLEKMKETETNSPKKKGRDKKGL